MDQLSGDEHKTSDSYDLSKWIEFEDDYIKEQQTQNIDWYKANKQPIRKWGLGGVFDSFTFPQSLAGYIVRRPGRYHRMNAKTGHFVKDELLENTNERIHASVRARKVFRGRGLEEAGKGNIIWSFFMGLVRKVTGHDQAVYNPPALHGWRLHDVHEYHDQRFADGSKVPHVDVSGGTESRTPWWEWEGTDSHVARGTKLQEDRLGRYELQLLEKFPDEAREIEASNSGVSSTKELESLHETQMKRSVTAPG